MYWKNNIEYLSKNCPTFFMRNIGKKIENGAKLIPVRYIISSCDLRASLKTWEQIEKVSKYASCI